MSTTDADSTAQLGFEGMPRRLYACTPSRITAWLDCLRRYRMAYLVRPPPPMVPPLGPNWLGASVHNVFVVRWPLVRPTVPPAAPAAPTAAGLLSAGHRDY